MDLSELNTIEEKKAKLKELLKEFRICEEESERESELYMEINAIITPIIESIISSGITDFFLPDEIERLEPRDLFMPINEYNAIFVEDIALALKNGTYNNLPDEHFFKILNLLEYMIDKNIRSYSLY
jgi:hypothetical protein